MKKFVVFLIVAALLAAGYFFILKPQMSKKKMNAVNAKMFGMRKRDVTVKKGEITVKIEETGTIQPIREINITSQVGGKLVHFYVDEGDFVNKGDLIADIEPDYEQSASISNKKSAYIRARITKKNAKEDYENNLNLFKDNYISRQTLDDSKDELDQAVINFDIAEQQYNLVKEIEIENNISKVYATASGTIIKREVEEGEMVRSNIGSYSDGTVLIVLADLQQMIVKSSINEIDIAKISRNQQVQIQVDAFPYEKFQGVINKVSAMAVSENNVKVFPIEIQISNTDSRLRPGMSANVSIIGETRKDILVIPIRAIFSDGEGNDIVYKIQSDTLTTKTVVKTGLNDLLKVEIVSGLQEGDKLSLSAPVRRNMKKM